LVPAARAAAGEPDPTFGLGGLVIHEFTPKQFGSSSSFETLELVPGGIDAAGYARRSGGGSWFALVARFNEAGGLDPSFANSGGFVGIFSEFNPTTLYSDTMDGEVPQADGSIVVAGGRIAGRLTASGQVDGSFNHQGERIEINALAPLPNGDILAAGHQELPEGHPGRPAAVERWLPGGARDPSFGHAGEVQIPLPTGTGQATNIIVLPEGKVLVAGWGYLAGSEPKTEEFVWVARLNPNGVLDGSFGSGGIARVRSYGSHAALALQPTGRIVLFGGEPTPPPGPCCEQQGYQTVAWGFTEQGQPDPSFGEDGIAKLPSANPSLPNSVAAAAVDGAGRLLIVANQPPYATKPQPSFVARLTAAGRLDPSYGHGGIAEGPEGSYFSAIAVDPLGRATVAGADGQGALLERLQGDISPAPAPPQSGPASSPNSRLRPSATRPGIRWRLRCRGLRSRRPRARATLLSCTLTVTKLPGRWSSLEASISRGHTRLAHARTRVHKLPVVLHFPSAISRRRGVYVLAIVLRRHRGSVRLIEPLRALPRS
jgi:uncharacterized delta-60 repeat protein